MSVLTKILITTNKKEKNENILNTLHSKFEENRNVLANSEEEENKKSEMNGNLQVLK